MPRIEWLAVGHLHIHHETGARPVIIWASLISLLMMFVVLMIYVLREQPATALVVTLAVSVLVEWAYRRWTGRRFQLLTDVPHRG